MIDSLILQAQKQLLSPYLFYRLCQQIIQAQNGKKIYFYEPNPEFISRNTEIKIKDLRLFFDWLAHYLRRQTQIGFKTKFYLYKLLIFQPKPRKLVKKIKVTQITNYRCQNLGRKPLKISLEIAGAGMIGRVAKIQLNSSEFFAFKAFFDPHFVWQHGPWAEIPIGIYLKANQVTKNMAEFQFAGQDWAVWEWIEPQMQPQFRSGITYEEFAPKQGLSRLNPLNFSNYNPYQIRLDAGGIQAEYYGRILVELWQSILYYLRKIKREGWQSLLVYLEKDKLQYLYIRLLTWLLHKAPLKRAKYYLINIKKTIII